MQDRFGREITYLRLSVTDLCDLRCRYCMPADGVCKKRHEDMLTQEEMVSAVRAAASLGITKVRITGGEPLVKKNLVSLCRQISAVPGIREVCLTTNGLGLPELAAPLRDAGVSRVNLSLDTLDPQKYAWITRVGTLDRALAGLHAALEAGFSQVKINTVLLGGINEDEIPALAQLTQTYPLDVRFIELMPMLDPQEGLPPSSYLSADAVLQALPEAVPLLSPDGSSPEGVAQLYRLPGAQGCVGLIRPISQHFCDRCNRIRLTADGKIKPCLHSGAEYSIKGLSMAEMTEQFRTAILAKPSRHGVLSYEHPSGARRDMSQIGG